MRKPSAAFILSVLLVLSWVGFFASQPRAAQEEQVVTWLYSRVQGEKELSERGKNGWEAYAVAKPESGLTTYFIKLRRR
jgi:hypothetical protein